MIYKMLEIEARHALRDLGMPKPLQLFVTKSCILQRKVQEYYDKIEDAVWVSQLGKKHSSNEARRRQLAKPRSFSELNDDHFPLFITHDDVRFSPGVVSLVTDHYQLYNLLENDIRAIESQVSDWERGTRRSLVTFERFVAAYWVHFPQPVKKGLGR